jgi:hypothetical protein
MRDIGRAAFAVLCFLLLFSVVHTTLHAQKRKKVEYYRSPYEFAASLDPLGFFLDRMGGKFEFRDDPFYSYYVDFTYQRDASIRGELSSVDVKTIGFGSRVYFRDNAAIEGLYAGLGLGGGTVNSSRDWCLRVTAEVGYKLKLGEKTQWFIEPNVVVDAFLAGVKEQRRVFPYVSVPFGYLW